MQYKALKNFEVGPEESHTLYEVGAIFEDTNVYLDIPTLIADGSIEAVQQVPDLDQLRDEKVVPVARGVLIDMATDLLPEDGNIGTTYAGMVLKITQRALDADLNVVQENPYLFQLVLGALSTLNKAVHTMELTPIDEIRYMGIGRKVLSILATVDLPMGGKVKMTDEEEMAAFAPAKEQITALFAAEKLNLMEVKYIMDQIFDSFSAVQTTFMTAVASFSQRAEAKALGLEDFGDLSMKKINDVLTTPVPVAGGDSSAKNSN